MRACAGGSTAVCATRGLQSHCPKPAGRNPSAFPLLNREYTSYRSFILPLRAGCQIYPDAGRGAHLPAEDTGVFRIVSVIVYVTEYFGHYNMRERIHKHSIAQREGWKDPDAIDW